MLGNDGQDRQFGTIKELIRNVVQADNSVLGYQWNPRGVVSIRTSQTEHLCGDPHGRWFDVDGPDRPFDRAPGVEREYTESELWDNYERFLEAVFPVARKPTSS